MCMPSAPSMPAAPPPPPPPPEPPKEVNEAVSRARTDERRRARAATGYSSTVLTSSGGLGATGQGAAATAGKSLLGQ
jgi:hypothetical protein